MEAAFFENLPPEQRAEILAEALPYIRSFRGKRIVIKYGGNAMTFNPDGDPSGIALILPLFLAGFVVWRKRPR